MPPPPTLLGAKSATWLSPDESAAKWSGERVAGEEVDFFFFFFFFFFFLV